MSIPATSNLSQIVNGQALDATPVHDELVNIEARALDAGNTSGDVMQGPLNFGLDTGAANAYVVALSPALTTLALGQMVSFKAVNANTGASTLNVNGLGAKNILNVAAAMAAGEIAAGEVVTVKYDGTAWQRISVGGLARLAVANIYTEDQTIQKSTPKLSLRRASDSENEVLEFLKANGTLQGNFYVNSSGEYVFADSTGATKLVINQSGAVTTGIVPLARYAVPVSGNSPQSVDVVSGDYILVSIQALVSGTASSGGFVQMGGSFSGVTIDPTGAPIEGFWIATGGSISGKTIQAFGIVKATSTGTLSVSVAQNSEAVGLSLSAAKVHLVKLIA